VLRQDWATKRGAKIQNWKKRYCVLFGDRILEYFYIKGQVDLSHIIGVTKTNHGPHCLCIATRDRKPFLIRFETEEIQNLWLSSLQKLQGLSEVPPSMREAYFLDALDDGVEVGTPPRDGGSPIPGQPFKKK